MSNGAKREQADSDGNFVGKTLEQPGELYAEKFPEYFEADDLAPIQGTHPNTRTNGGR